MKIIQSEEYLQYALQFTPKEIQLRNFFKVWLPNDIIDCHSHIGLTECVEELEDAVYFRPFSSFPDFNLEKSQKIREFFYPGKKIRALRFSQPYHGIDHRKVNDYLLKECPLTDRVALYGIPDDINYTIRLLSDVRIVALKMYYFFFIPPASKIYSFFPKPILEEAQFNGIPIILHLPGNLSHTINQLIQLINDFPKLIIVLAHLGGYTESLDILREAYRYLAEYKTIYLDTSMVFSSDAIKLVLDFFGESRILYGSDEPLSYLRVKIYKHPQLGPRLIGKYPYHWLSKEDFRTYKYLASDVVHAHWQTLLAIQAAIKDYSNEDLLKEKIFFTNSKELFSFL